MQPEKGPFIKEIRDGQNITGLFLVKEMSRAETRAGKPYLILTVMDRSGEIAGRVWDDADRWAAQCQAGAVVLLTGQAQAYKGVLQLKISTLKGEDQRDMDMALFVPAAPGDLESMAADLIGLAGSVDNPHLKNLLLGFFKDHAFMKRFTRAPAAKHMHHAYVGGLLEHTLAVARLADRIAALYPSVDRSLLLTGALLHDVGKVVEFSYDALPFDYSDTGRLVGHMVLGVEMIQEKIGMLSDFPEELGVKLKHLVLSHHGRYEFGSPTLPMMSEAFVLNFLDDLDAKVNYMDRLSTQVQETGYQWTDYQRNLERFLYVRGHGSEEAAPGQPPATGAEPDEAAAALRQPNLWK